MATTDFTEPNDRTIYVRPDGRLTVTGLKLFRAVWKLLGGYQAIDQDSVLNKAEAFAELRRPEMVPINVRGEGLAQVRAEAGGFVVNADAPNLLQVPGQQRLPAHDLAQAALVTQTIGVLQ